MNRKYRKTIIAGNWKMNKLASEVKPFVEELRGMMPKTKSCETVLCVPYPLIPAVSKAIRDSRLSYGAQDVSVHDSGAYTGEVAAPMLADLGVKYCIVGHSERREYHAETDAMVNAKAKILLAAGITPIICVGESLDQREKGLTMEYVDYQLDCTAVYEWQPYDEDGADDDEYDEKYDVQEHRILERALFVSFEGKLIYLGGVPLSARPVRRAPKVGRNDPCPCGSGKKYKKCCGKNV